ncbi:MAG: transglycosylase SLT domain-containing protein [Methylococcales bacterium]|nr:transglycosylase SLT domain-containing protein [Methylococcales bacterium]
MAFDSDDDKTVLRPRQIDKEADADRTIIFQSSALSVSVLGAEGGTMATYTFTQAFTAGRALDNNIVIDNVGVSRHHLEVKLENGGWWVYNLQSANGVYICDKLVGYREKLALPALVSLGRSGIWLKIQTSQHGENEVQSVAAESFTAPSKPQRNLSPEDIKARLLADEAAEDSGDYTIMVRKLIHEDRTIRKKSYKKIIWLLAGLFSLSIGLVAYQQIALANTRKLAIEMFYDIKTLEVSLSQADLKLEESADALDKTVTAMASEKQKLVREQLKAEQVKLAAEKKRMLLDREKLAAMKSKYRQYVQEANSLRLRFPTAKQYEDELITKVASELGESELELPDGFVEEVRNYIHYWQGSSRMQKAMETIEKNNYLPIVMEALKKHGLPPYFMYLPLQESNYNAQAIGPETRFGVAKGAWQLLASTAQDYGVAAGPLANATVYDEQDARFDFKQSTAAGTRYLKRIYSTEAQASGLLVMASYNYGDNRVRRMIKQMPDNPRDKNFWKFIQQYELPKETHDYVFYIFAAAVIGEDPQHFGFKFKPPLLVAEEESQAEIIPKIPGKAKK